VIWWRGAVRGASAAGWAWSGIWMMLLAWPDWLVAMSLLQFRAQPQGFAEGLAHPPFGPLSTPRCPGQLNELPCQALLLGLRQHLAVPFTGELAGNMWVHVTHLLSAQLMDDRARREDPHLARAGPACCPVADDQGQVQLAWWIATTAWLARMVTSADAVSIRRPSLRAAARLPTHSGQAATWAPAAPGGPARLR
jgi:hypothetical protein